MSTSRPVHPQTHNDRPPRGGGTPQPAPSYRRWSSAWAHLSGRDDELVRTKPLLGQVDDSQVFLGEPLSADELEPIRAGEQTGRPLGAALFVKQLERNWDEGLSKQSLAPSRGRTRATELSIVSP